MISKVMSALVLLMPCIAGALDLGLASFADSWDFEGSYDFGGSYDYGYNTIQVSGRQQQLMFESAEGATQTGPWCFPMCLFLSRSMRGNQSE